MDSDNIVIPTVVKPDGKRLSISVIDGKLKIEEQKEDERPIDAPLSFVPRKKSTKILSTKIYSLPTVKKDLMNSDDAERQIEVKRADDNAVSKCSKSEDSSNTATCSTPTRVFFGGWLLRQTIFYILAVFMFLEHRLLISVLSLSAAATGVKTIAWYMHTVLGDHQLLPPSLTPNSPKAKQFAFVIVKVVMSWFVAFHFFSDTLYKTTDLTKCLLKAKQQRFVAKTKFASATLFYFAMAENTYTQEQLELAIRLTDELDVNNAPQQTKKGVTQPYHSGYYMLYYALKEEIGHQKCFGRPLVNDLWRDIGDTCKRKWDTACKNTKTAFKQEGKVRVKIADKKTKAKKELRFCRYCALATTQCSFSIIHLRDVHYPQIGDDQELEEMLKEDIKNAKKKSYTDEFHDECIDFWDCLHADEQDLSEEEREKIERYTSMYESLLQGTPANTLYGAIQLPDNFDDIEDQDLPKEITRYTGQYSKMLRHLYVDSKGTAGNIAREIRKLVTKRIQHYNEDGTNIPNSKRLYFWDALRVPADSIDVFEQAVVMANWQLCGRDSIFWNQKINAIPQAKQFRTAKPDDVVFLGLFIVRQLMLKLRANVVNGIPNDSVELFQTYDNFTLEQKVRFDRNYKIGSEENPIFPTHLTADFVNALQQLAETQANSALSQLIAQFRQSLQVANEPHNEEDEISEDGE